MSTPRVTVGLPVRNGGSELEACLDCLTGQTFRDIEIIIADNASDDRTQEIVEAAMGRDSRIKYIRHADNIGSMGNFAFVLDSAKSEYFLWRAFDDLSDPAYIAHLVAALDANPEAMLAVPCVEVVRPRTGHSRTRLPPSPANLPQGELAAKRWVLRHARAGWIYGMYRREFLAQHFHRIKNEFHYVAFWDFLMLSAVALFGKVVGVPEATFSLQLTSATKEYSLSETLPERTALARNYWLVLCRMLSELRLPPSQRLLFKLTFLWHMHRRVAKWPMLLRAALYKSI